MPTSHALPHTPHGAELSRWCLVGFFSGAASVLVFHQAAVALFHLLALTERQPYPLQPTSPWGVPQIWSLVFWGAVWGLLLAVTFARLDGMRLLVAATAFGAILPTLVARFGLWGLGTGIGLALFGRRRSPHD
jgi:hypothetical protein